MNIEKHVEKVESGNVQTKNTRVEKNGEQIMKNILQKLYVQRNIWRGCNMNSLC